MLRLIRVGVYTEIRNNDEHDKQVAIATCFFICDKYYYANFKLRINDGSQT